MYVCWQVVKAVERYVIYDSLRYYKEVRNDWKEGRTRNRRTEIDKRGRSKTREKRSENKEKKMGRGQVFVPSTGQSIRV